MLLVIEDLHWADRSTRELLAFLARTLCTERLLVVGTYRSDELHRRHPLRPLLAELERDPTRACRARAASRRDELAEQLEDILGEPPDPGLVERLYARSEGNPLFAEELLAAGLDGRGALPPTLRDALMLRVERLSPTPRRSVLRWLACQPPRRRPARERSPASSRARAARGRCARPSASHIVVAHADGSYGVPPRAAARGRLRRPAPRRARRAARRARARARASALEHATTART